MFQSTGIDLIDQLLPDRISPGKVYLHCAPINQGKTTLALSLAAATTTREYDTSSCRTVLHFDLEFNVTAPASFRSAGASVTRDVSRQMLLSNTNAKPTREETDRLRSFAMAEQMCFASFSLREQGLDRISTIHGLATSRNPVALIVIDSLSALVDMDAHDFGGTPNPKMYVNALHSLRDIAKSIGCPVWVTHQLAPLENEREGGALPDYEKILGCRNLWKYVDAGFASGMLNRQNHAVFRTFPDEAGDTRQLIGHLRSDIACWSVADTGWQIWKGMASQRTERFSAQSYMKPGWDARAAGFAV